MKRWDYWERQAEFQSTLPARGATSSDKIAALRRTISIHAPRTGSDAFDFRKYQNGWIFQSTLPARGATGVPLPRELRRI